MITVAHAGAASPPRAGGRSVPGDKTKEVLQFVAIWAGVFVLAVAVEVGGLYLLDALR